MDCSEKLSALELELVERLQVAFPLSLRPYGELAEVLNASEEAIFQTVLNLRRKSILRRISAVIEAKRLGFSSALIGAKVRPEYIEAAAQWINRHPGVSHNYQRQGHFNLWFTLLTPPGGRLGFDETVKILLDRPEITTFGVFFALKTFKLNLHLPAPAAFYPTAWSSAQSGGEAERESLSLPANDLSPKDKALIEALQRDLPDGLRPLGVLVDRLGLTFDDFIAATARLREMGILRRYAGSFGHQRLGYRAGLMVAWQAAPDQVDSSGRLFAGYAAVSHCYLRTTHMDWPFGLYTMIHGRTATDCQATLDDMRRRSKLDCRHTLSSVREFKKTRVELFSTAFQAWEAEFSG